MTEAILFAVFVAIVARLIFKSGQNGPAPWGMGTWW